MGRPGLGRGQRLILLTIVTLGCFMCRLVMLAFKFAVIENPDDSSSGIYFADTTWFVLADFIPRFIPALMWALVIRTPRADNEAELITSDISLN